MARTHRRYSYRKSKRWNPGNHELFVADRGPASVRSGEKKYYYDGYAWVLRGTKGRYFFQCVTRDEWVDVTDDGPFKTIKEALKFVASKNRKSRHNPAKRRGGSYRRVGSMKHNWNEGPNRRGRRGARSFLKRRLRRAERRAGRVNPRRRYSRKGMTRAGLRRGMLAHLGQMNPRGRARGGRKFTSHRRGRKWESVVHGSLPFWANPRRKWRKSRRGRR